MEKKTQCNLVFHAGGVILLGMLSGIPYSMALLGQISGAATDWQISHMEGLLNGLLMLGIAAAGSLMTLSRLQEKLFYGFVVFTGYGNALYGWARGISGESGVEDTGTLASLIVQMLGGFPVITAFAFIVMLMIGARKSASRVASES